MRDENWNKAWKGTITGLTNLFWIPNEADSERIREIIKELNCIVDRNTIKIDTSKVKED